MGSFHRDGASATPARRCARVKIVLWGLLAFALLTIRFSPNWVVFAAGVREAKANISSPAQLAAIDRAVLNSYSGRGYYVLQQSANLNTSIDDPRHKIVRWRLLVPLLGFIFALPAAAILGMAQVGCCALILAVVAIGYRSASDPGRPGAEAVCLGLVAGASAPFFTSMGLLGYYDSWLALALVAVAFARRRWVVALACLLAPWIDERFVLGLPLALGVRWLVADPARSLWAWVREQALLPLLLAGGFALLRLRLGGAGGSQTVGAYLNEFVLAEKITGFQRLVGAWEGLRFGWILVAAAVLWGGRAASAGNRRRAILLGAGVIVTGLLGLFTALDLARSMVLLLPVVPLGWLLAARTPAWRRYRLAPLLAAAALLLPGHHVVGGLSRPVDNLWSPPQPLVTAENALGVIYSHGTGVPPDSVAAMRWYRRAAEQGSPEAQHNLAVMYARGEGVPRDYAQAAQWYRRAAQQGFAHSQGNLGMLYARGAGVPQDGAEAVKWLRRAARQGNLVAEYNLGVLYADGTAVPRDTAAAVSCYLRAVAQGFAEAGNNLGVLYGSGDGVPRDAVQACRWFLVASALGSAGAARNLAEIKAELSPDQFAEASRLARAPLSPPPPPPPPD